ncbi:MAG: hypothetical protein WB988_09995 [Candidatus Nitrosopolaris sp.]
MGKKDELVDVGDTASCGEVPTVNFSSTTINFTWDHSLSIIGSSNYAYTKKYSSMG